MFYVEYLDGIFADLDILPCKQMVRRIKQEQTMFVERINWETRLASNWNWDREFVKYAARHFNPCQLMLSNFLTIESLKQL
jgi:hypothetical protein